MNPETSIYEYAKQSLKISAERPAIWFHDKCMTYTELFERIDNMADNLAQLGVKEGAIVTLHLPNCPQTVISIYAVAKLGAICNMVHPQMPGEALKNYMRFTESPILVSCDHTIMKQKITRTAIFVDVMSYMDGFAKTEAPAENMLSFDALVQPAAVSANIPDQAGLAEKCAAYMHSTGTTGMPKTVMLSHKAINSWVENLKVHFNNSAMHEMVYFSATPPYHCLGFIGNIHQAASYGAASVIFENWNSDRAVDAIKKYRVTCIIHVPSVFQDLLRNSNFTGEDIAQVRYGIICGEQVPPELIQAFDQRIGNGRVTLTGYGSTESGGVSCGLFHQDHKITASGYTLQGTEMMVLDSEGHLKSTGEGQMLVHSESLMMGYLKDPAATEEAFMKVGDILWLKTGDYGRIEADGAIYFMGRIKDIIIRKGNNVIPSEVEKVIRSVSKVAEVCVLGVPDRENATETVCAVLVIAPGADEEKIKESVLRECRKILPHYAVPGKIVFTNQIPRNQMGKTYRKALKEQL